MKPRITVFVGPDHDLVHTSLVLAGMCALARAGDAQVVFHRPRGDETWLAADPVVVCFDVDTPRPRRVAIDLRDGEGISQPIIDRVDWYLKRAFYPPEIHRLTAYAAKMRPFGLNYGCRTGDSTWRTMATIGMPILQRGRAGMMRLRHYFTTPDVAVFEQSPGVAVDAAVAYQTRLWTPQEATADDVEELNGGRVAMVRALKREFGTRFIGGLVPTPYARERYPDDLTPHTSKYAEYLAIKKRCLIAVYTRGVEHSLAFKLGETFAASQCLVSEPLRYGLPVALEEGRHYLEFQTTEQCLAACHRLLADPAAAARMRQANHAYYCEEVEPGAHLRRVLDRTLAA